MITKFLELITMTVTITVKTFQGATEPSHLDLPLWAGPPPNTFPRTCFGPDFDLISTLLLTRNPTFQVEIGFKSGPGSGSEAVWARGVGPVGLAL